MIDTRFSDPVSWANATTILISKFGFIPKLTDPTKWQAWAGFVVNVPGIAALNAPRPEGFSDWQDWAKQFNQQVRNAGI